MVTIKNTKTLITTALLIVVLLHSCGPGKDARQVPTGKVQKGTFYIDMYEEGEIEAVNSINIASPMISWRYGNLKITQLVKDGDEVKEGDTIMVFDPTEVNKAIVESEGRLEISLAELEKMVAQHQSEMEELNADYSVTKISQEISRIRFEQASHESDIRKKEIQLNLEKANIALERAKEQIDNRTKIQAEEIKQKKLSIEQDRSRLREAHETLDKLSVISPSPGISIISHNWNTGNKFQIGDQCWPGHMLVQLPNLSELKATVKINEVDIAKIEKGLNVEIRPDAFSEDVFSGYIHTVANLAVNKEGSNKIKVFPVQVYLNETHEKLLPGLTVSCRIIIDKIDDVLFIPLDALRMEDGKEFVYKKSGAGYNRVEVEIGQSNSDYIIVTGGLKAGDDIALADPYAESASSENNAEQKTNE